MTSTDFLSLSHWLQITKACWKMQLLWESVESPGHNSSVSDVVEDSFSGSNVLIEETINTRDCYAVGWDTGNSCLQSQWYHFDGNNPSSCQPYTWIWNSTMTTKTYCAPCNLRAKKFGRGQRGVREEVDGTMGRNDESEGRGLFCFPYFLPTEQSPCWHLIFAVINIFRRRHTKCKVTLAANLRRAQLIARRNVK